jgi:bifunctional non-homologous end joining protein LigD
MPPRVLPLPKVSPIVLLERPLPFDDPDWLFEPKFDGFRGLLYIDRDDATFYSRKGLVLKRFARLASHVRQVLGVRNAILDGEVLAIDDTGQHNFRSLMSGLGHLHYAAFDLLWMNDRDLRETPLVRRRPQLEKLIPRTAPLLSRTLMVPGAGRDLFEAVKRLDLEGIVCKRAIDPYGPKTVWFKVKNRNYSQMTDDRFERFKGP